MLAPNLQKFVLHNTKYKDFYPPAPSFNIKIDCKYFSQIYVSILNSLSFFFIVKLKHRTLTDLQQPIVCPFGDRGVTVDEN